MRVALVLALVATAACGGKKKAGAGSGEPSAGEPASGEPASGEHTASCDAKRAAASRVHVAFSQDWVLHAEARSPAGLCAAIAKEANDLKDTPPELLADVKAAALDTAACTKDPQALADKLDAIAEHYDTSLDDRCPPAIQGAGTPK